MYQYIYINKKCNNTNQNGINLGPVYQFCCPCYCPFLDGEPPSGCASQSLTVCEPVMKDCAGVGERSCEHCLGSIQKMRANKE